MHWLLSIWICAMPGVMGECREVMPQQPQPTRTICRRAAVAAQRADPRVHAHCHLRSRYRADQRDP